MVIFFDTFSFWQTFEPNLRNTFPIGQIFIVVNVQILKNYLVIWSHWLCYMRALTASHIIWSSLDQALTTSRFIWKLWQLPILYESFDSFSFYLIAVTAAYFILKLLQLHLLFQRDVVYKEYILEHFLPISKQTPKTIDIYRV